MKREHKTWFKDGEIFLTPVKITLPMLLITQVFGRAESKAEAKAAQDAALAAEKEQKAKEQEIECMRSDNPECYISKHEQEIMYVKKLSRILLSTNLSGLMELQNQNFPLSWYDKNKLVTLYGHRAQAQNGFGAFKNIQYSCTYNADTGEVLSTDLQ
ncbi:hypothetical protein ACP3P6_06160 [Enterobacter mori]